MRGNSRENINDTIYKILHLDKFHDTFSDTLEEYLTNYQYDLNYATVCDHDMTMTLEISFCPRNPEENELFRHANGYEEDEERNRDADLTVFPRLEMDWNFDKYTVYAASNYVDDEGHEVGVIMFNDLVAYILDLGLSEEKTAEVENILKTAIDESVAAAIAHAEENTKETPKA